MVSSRSVQPERRETIEHLVLVWAVPAEADRMVSYPESHARYYYHDDGFLVDKDQVVVETSDWYTTSAKGRQEYYPSSIFVDQRYIERRTMSSRRESGSKLELRS